MTGSVRNAAPAKTSLKKVNSIFIKSSSLFCDLDEAGIAEIDRISHVKKYNAGSTLFTEEEPADFLFLLVDGSVQLVKSSSSGKEQVIRTVLPGETFAEAAVFSGTTYPATAVFASASSVLSISKSRLLDLIKKRPDISLKMMGAMAKLLRHLNSMLSMVSLDSVETRLIRFLLKRSADSGSLRFDLGMKKQDLAKNLGTISETLSRNLGKLKKKKLIKVDGQQITIIDIKKLNRLLENPE